MTFLYKETDSHPSAMFKSWFLLFIWIRIALKMWDQKKKVNDVSSSVPQGLVYQTLLKCYERKVYLVYKVIVSAKW